jgi:DNA-binding beta-propeller fold protein YncE
VQAPGSVVGPPMAVAVASDESYAIVTGATKADPAAPAGIGPDDRVSVIDLTASPPKVVQTLNAGAGATTVRISPDGTLALIANRTAGTVSIFTIKDRRLTAAGTLTIDPKSMPSGIAFLPDGKTALLSRQGDHQIAVLRIDGAKVTIDKRPITVGVAPYTLDITANGKLAAVGNMGRGDGDADTVSLIDLGAEPFRTVQTLTVGRSPEGLKWSPDGRFLAIGAQNGTAKLPDNPFFQKQGRLMMLALEGKALHPVAEAPIGRWNQGIAFSRDGKTLLVQNMVERNIMVFGWNGHTLTPQGALDIGAGPAAIMTPWK